MRCQEARILLSTARDLNRSQRSELDAHVASCRACAAARAEEQQVSRVLAGLPDPGLRTPPRVAAALGVQAARRSLAARFRRQGALAASVGAMVILVVVLLNSAAGGSLGWLFFRSASGAQTAEQPALETPRADILYLIARDGETDAQVIAWDPARREARYRLPLGNAPVYRFTSDISSGPGGEMQVSPRDLILSPTGDTLYLIEYVPHAPQLVAYETTSGTERWRTPLSDFEAFVSFSALVDGESDFRENLSISPDGAYLFVRGLAPSAIPHRESPPLEFRVYAAVDGRQVAGTTLLPQEASLLPLSRDEVLAFGPRGITARIALGQEQPSESEYLAESIASPILMPGGQAVRAVKLGLSILDLAFTDGGLQVIGETDLVERGGFFFDQAHFSADGQILTVGQTVRDSAGGARRSEVRVYAAAPWREIARHSFEAPLKGLGMDRTGTTIYAVLGPAPTTPDTGRGQLVTIDIASGQVRDRYTPEYSVVGVLVGP